MLGNNGNKDLIGKVLSPYKSNCHYLQHAAIERVQSNDKYQGLIARGQFSIPEPCYIQSTGHFNSVDFNICYNQLVYYLLAECIDNKLLSVFSTWDIDKFSQHQLSNFYIVNMSSSFHKPINSERFKGYITIEKVLTNKNDTIFIQTSCRFNDDYTGYAEGRVLLAITPHSSVKPATS